MGEAISDLFVPDKVGRKSSKYTKAERDKLRKRKAKYLTEIDKAGLTDDEVINLPIAELKKTIGIVKGGMTAAVRMANKRAKDSLLKLKGKPKQ